MDGSLQMNVLAATLTATDERTLPVTTAANPKRVSRTERPMATAPNSRPSSKGPLPDATPFQFLRSRFQQAAVSVRLYSHLMEVSSRLAQRGGILGRPA